jgi:glycosyltransferase involved in cell wall biosynthesis
MRIAQIAPLFESVPPSRYGGTERIVSYLTEDLVQRGHDVTLFASADSVTKARLVSCVEQGLRGRGDSDATVFRAITLRLILERLSEFDLLHFHDGVVHLPVAQHLRLRHLTTLHERLDAPELDHLLTLCPDCPLVSVSLSQQAAIPTANWLGVVPHGVPAPEFQDVTPENYVAFVGRITPEKGLEYAIEIARRAQKPLRVAAKTDSRAHLDYGKRLDSLLRGAGVDFAGELGQCEKLDLMRSAYAVLFPITWPEPLGLVLIEAMACGTPVVAFRRGAVPELIVDGITGYAVNNVDEAVAALQCLTSFNRQRCRAVYEQRFTVARMTTDYLALYRRL